MSDCSDFGTATVQTTPDGPRWLHADADIHITPELLKDSAAIEFIRAKYRIGERCPTSDTIHAHILETI